MERFDRQLDRPQLGRPDCARQEGNGRALGHPVTVTSESRPSHAVCVPLGKRWDAFGRCLPGTCASEIYAHPDVCASRQTRSSTHSIVAQTRARPSPTDAQRCHDGLRPTDSDKQGYGVGSNPKHPLLSLYPPEPTSHCLGPPTFKTPDSDAILRPRTLETWPQPRPAQDRAPLRRALPSPRAALAVELEAAGSTLPLPLAASAGRASIAARPSPPPVSRVRSGVQGKVPTT